jgi:hypothetical protein
MNSNLDGAHSYKIRQQIKTKEKNLQFRFFFYTGAITVTDFI